MTGRVISVETRKRQNLSCPAGLLGVYHQIHGEACSIFYAKSTFAFEDSESAMLFLDNMTSVAVGSRTRLGVKHRQYNSSDSTGDLKTKMKHDCLWRDLCVRIATQHITLRRLSL